jgi:pimeloyl-ACP methyl ester carboxylesterase
MGIREPGAQAFRAIAPLDADVLFLPVGDSLTDTLKMQRPRMYERYLRIRSTATRLEYMRHPRERHPTTLAETAAIAETITRVSSPMLVIVGALGPLVTAARRLHDLVPHSRYREIAASPHNVYYETAQAWNEAVDTFLTDAAGHR